MKCPTDGTPLALSERSGIEIDYCPECRGVWLDRGELDKIIERAGDGFGSSPSTGYGDQRDRHGSSRNDHHGSTRDGYGQRRRGGWLGDLFD
ncbi:MULTISPECIES: zf-TFIIB domain-containing protein [Actinomycetes]|jgi:Zn-finger nucleic acid-binding protein|uniref:TFIIB-type zinc ribbon-containing protein n=1 Tax=Actinomycetes TaxID=1760 RepID=UPI0009DC0FF1|nr:zf-TFIIB domain-containing protein [Propionibacterium cyclohexanicum]QOL37017.1 zf-TFIIB domain-containing protein [Bifidobacterium subtile]